MSWVSKNNLTPYAGNFGTALRMPTGMTAGASATQIASRTRHMIRAGVLNPQFSFPNFMLVANNGGLETGPGAAATVSCGILLNGVVHQCTWSGSPTVVIADKAESPLCDPLDGVYLPNGSAVLADSYYSNPAGIIHELGASGTEALDATNGEVFRFALSGLADQTLNTAAPTGGSGTPNLRYGPCRMVGQIVEPSIALYGTSLDMGFGETALAQSSYGGMYGDKGILARCLGPYFGYMNLAQGGSSLVHFLTTGDRALRMAFADNASHIVLGCPINDLLQTTDSAAVIAARMTAFAALFPGKQVWTATVTPDTTGAWTLANQSDQTIVTSNSFSTRLPQLNALIRAGIPGFAGYFECADAAMGTRDSNKWFANGTAAFMTSGGLHQSTRGAEYMRSTGLIDVTKIRR